MQNSHCLLGLVVKGFWNLKKHRLYIDNLTVVTLHYFSAIYKKKLSANGYFSINWPFLAWLYEFESPITSPGP